MTVLQDEVAPALAVHLDSLLATLAPSNPIGRALAYERLAAVAEQYRASFPIRDSDGRLTRPSVAAGRAALAALNKHLAAALSTFETLPLDAREALATEAEFPLGALEAALKKFAPAAKSANAALSKRPNKPTDAECACLAMEVAVVFRDILDIAPKSTRISGSNVTGKRGGGAYAQVLKATLALAGRPTADLGPIIDRGLELLANPELPHNLV